MPTPQAVGTLGRPPLVKAGSSSSSLDGMEQLARSFQNFIKRTPPVLDHQKPLPPPPLIPRRASSSSPPRSRTPSYFAGRRSSSVYSRTVSQWDSDSVSWRSADFADEPILPVPILHALAYSASTPHLVEKQPTPPLLQPGTYGPLIRTPSRTTASQVTTPGLTPDERLTVWPSCVQSAQAPRKHMRTISLEEAKAAVHAPGAVHLLPEELRAKTFRRSRSHEALRIVHVDVCSPAAAPGFSDPPTLVDNQGRRRTIVSPKDTFASSSEFPFPVVNGRTKHVQASFNVGTGPERPMVPLATQQRQASKEKVVQALGLDEFDEPRGRTRHHGPRNVNYAHYLPNSKRVTNDSSHESEPKAQRIAKEYHALLSEQYRKPSSSPGYHSTDSDDKIKAYTKMVPQPLFQTKPAAKHPRQLDRIDDGEFSSPYSLSPRIGEIGGPTRAASDSGGDMLPLTLSLTPETNHNRRSTSGSIPISPPEPINKGGTAQSPQPAMTERKTAPLSRRKGDNNRVSAYYPHVASRKGTKTRKNIKFSANGSEIPPMPCLSNDSHEQKVQAAGHQPSSSPRAAKPSTTLNSNGKVRRKSDASSNKTRQPFHQRVVKGAVSLLTQPEFPERTNHQPTTAATVSPGSPHLFPSPVNARQNEIHLGWSDVAKSTFDKIVSPTKSPQKAETPLFTHIVAPARPLDESKAGVKELESPRRKSSIFDGFLDSWKESKAERRREELKKIIRFVPYADGNTGNVNRRSSALGWM